MYTSARFLLVVLGLALGTGPVVQEFSPKRAEDVVSANEETRIVMNHVIEGLKRAERAQYLYERIERVEARKDSADADPQNVRVARVIPAGTGIAKIPLGRDAQPTDVEAYRVELDRLVKSLTWAAETGSQQREAYQRVQKNRRNATI